MSKKITSLIVFAGLFCLTGFALADGVSLTDPLGGKYKDFSELLWAIVPAVGSLIASLGTIMIIVAGILYLTSAGSPERIKTAKTALVYAIIGIAIGVAANAIVSIVKGIIGA